MVYYLSTSEEKEGDLLQELIFSPFNKADSDDPGNSYSHESSRNIMPSEGEALSFLQVSFIQHIQTQIDQTRSFSQQIVHFLLSRGC